MLYLGRVSSVWLTVSISANRYVAICHPLHANRICYRKNTTLTAVMIIAFIVLSYLPYLVAGILALFLPIEHFYNINKHVWAYIIMQHHDIFISYSAWGNILIPIVLPFLALLILNLLIWKAMQKAYKMRSVMTSSMQQSPTTEAVTESDRRQQKVISRMLMAVVIVFGICYSPLLLEFTLSFFPIESELLDMHLYRVMVFGKFQIVLLILLFIL